jgi:MinD-like ATPase involved in chromosome partitioning or flagellar assembly
MIPPDIRLYTWVDVEEVLHRAQQEPDWPNWLVWARAYWDNLTLGIRPGKQNEAKIWLSQKFEPRFDIESAVIFLESVQEKRRTLDVLFEETEEIPVQPRFLPSLARPSVLWPPYEYEHPLPLSPDWPPVVAFHSFKGGVGRTLLALALAQALTEEYAKESRILLVDGDLEAPGLSWLLRSRLPSPPVSFADLMALVHGDPHPDAKESIELVASRIREVLLGGIYVLPAFRSAAQFDSLEIRPEHLIQGAKDPFILTTMLAQLGKSLEVQAVIIDLRAGLSELSTGLLLDPRVYRVLVTTLSDQSVEGTCQVLKLLGQVAPSKQEEESLPALIFSQVTDEYSRGELLVPFEARLLEATRPFWEDESEDELGSPRLISSFDRRLLVLPSRWEDVMTRLDQSGVIEQVKPLAAWLPGIPASGVGVEESSGELLQQREQLVKFAERLIYAETGTTTEFLTTYPLRHLASDFGAKVPIAVVVGAKGAGKTYSFLQIVHRETWQTFIHDAGGPRASIAAFVCPVLKSLNLAEAASEMVRRTRRKTAEGLGLSSPCNSSRVSDYVKDSLKEDLHEGQWRERWLNAIAWSSGFEVGQDDAGRRFVDYLRARKQFVVAVLDGLEDLFQELTSQPNEQKALRSLLQEVPEWLEQQLSRPLGLLVLVRQDMVLNAVRQNPAQLLARYEPYALKWSPDEALRLTAWVAMQAKIPIQGKEDLQAMTNLSLVNALVPLWGRKLGSERSREARSAEWVITALSDLRGQIQARDVVRFLYRAAQISKTDEYWQDRVLAPTAIRRAVGTCSEEKIKEIGIENRKLRNIFERIEQLSDDARRIPFTREQVGLDVEELKALEDNGVVLREREEYYMPEIFRLGLGFKLKAGARPRVLALSRRARK